MSVAGGPSGAHEDLAVVAAPQDVIDPLMI
jgi:hypothetical protein